ncbi:hypothetical protein K2173_001659 [Erythroxylum novogranatense]|uniref:Protein IQ-DOMAIN 1 n=1 Tax=Erythroxylum novogranatense TaxID=1862640 RepID=A0AAV8T588_9ROSI|nr:hypothetical protein K2173_001659 [Erythroxylum novogranatense]
MGSGGWFKTIISSKKVNDKSSKQVKDSLSSGKSSGFKWKNKTHKKSLTLANGSTTRNPRVLSGPVEELAATRIQTAFRAYMARKSLRCLKGIARLQLLNLNHSKKKQTKSTLSYLHSWSNIQVQIRARRVCMVKEGQRRRKNLENQLKLEAKLHELEVEWCGGASTMEEVLTKIQQREEAAVKRERAMAYAFNHQWRANTGLNFGSLNYELGKANWGWSWTERWITARPWESRVPMQSTPRKAQNKQANKLGKNADSPTTKPPVSSKPPVHGKGGMKARRLSYPAAEKRATLGVGIKAEEASTRKEQSTS